MGRFDAIDAAYAAVVLGVAIAVLALYGTLLITA